MTHFPVEVVVDVGGYSEDVPVEDLVVTAVELQTRCGCTEGLFYDYGVGEHHE